MRSTNKKTFLLNLVRQCLISWCLVIGFSPIHAQNTDGSIPRPDISGLPSISAQHEEYLDSIEEAQQNNNAGLPSISQQHQEFQNSISNTANPRPNAPDPVPSPSEVSVSPGGTGSTTTTEEGGNVVKVEGNDVKAAGKFLFSNIALFAAGFFAPGLLKACPKSPSVWIFTGSAALYVANEIGLFTGFNQAINKEMVAYLGRGDEDRQIESLESASKQTREAKKAAKRRALIAKVAAVGFAAGAAMALVEANSLWGQKPCEGGFSITMVPERSPLILLPHNQFDPIQSPYFSHELSLTELGNKLAMDHNYYDQKITVENRISNYLVGNTYAGSSGHHDNQSEPINDGPVGTDKDAKIIEDKDGNKTIAVNKVGYKLAATGIGAAAGVAVGNYITSTGASKTVQSFTKNAYARAVGFGVFSGVAYGAATESDQAANALENRATEYDRLADSLRSRSSDDIELKTGTQTESTLGTTTDIGNDIGSGSQTTTCFKGGTGQLVADPNCSCSASNTCKKPEIPNVQGLPEFGGQGLLTDTMGDLRAAGSQLYSGKLAEGSAAANRVANSAARIKRLRDALQGKINKDRLKNGKKAIDFDKAEKGFKNQMERDLERAFNNLSPSQQETMANLTRGFGPSNNNDSSEEKEGQEESGSSTGKTAVAATDVNPNTGSVGSDKNADGGTWDFNFEPEEEAKAEQEALAAALAAEEDENYVVKGDINDDRNKDIFNIITRRYLKSAYPVIFEEK